VEAGFVEMEAVCDTLGEMDKQKKKEYDAERYIKAKLRRTKLRDPIDDLPETILAYLAGLIDGEGCLQIGIVQAKGQEPKLIPTLSIIMTDEDVLKWTASRLEVCCRALKRKNAPTYQKPQFKVVLTGKRLLLLLKRMIPFMIVKRKQAGVCIEFGETYIQQGGPAFRVPQEIMTARWELKYRVSALNRGIERHENKICADLHTRLGGAG
jgi:hypothetical protein